MTNLLHSRKFWLLILDTVISTVIFLGGRYLTSGDMDLVKFFIGALQPVFVMVIYANYAEDKAKLEAGVHPAQLAAWAASGIDDDEIAAGEAPAKG